jgi:hypothetical protein
VAFANWFPREPIFPLQPACPSALKTFNARLTAEYGLKDESVLQVRTNIQTEVAQQPGATTAELLVLRLFGTDRQRRFLSL